MGNHVLQYHILPPEQLQVYQGLKTQRWLETFYLAGGTGLALQLGHRQSIDLDFFSADDFDNTNLIQHLSTMGNFQRLMEEKNTLHGLLNNVKISFLKYPHPLLEQPLQDGCIQIAHVKDIAGMKLSAIVSRGSKKDFIDLYFILKKYSLEELIQFFDQKYHIPDYEYVILKALVYFDDAEEDPMPLMMHQISWEEIKNTIRQKVRAYRM